MKILQINAVNVVASTGRTCQEMAVLLREHGHDSITAYSKGISDNAEKEFFIGNSYDIKFHGLLSRISGKQGYFSCLVTKKLLNFTDEYEPDVVVLRNLHANYINLPMLLKYLAKKDIATVVVLHDCWFYTGKCCHYTIQGCYKWQEQCGNCPQLNKYNKSWFFDKTKEMLKDKKELFSAIPRLAVVGVSEWITNEARKAPVFSNAKVFKRIYNWIDTEKFSPKDTEKLREKLGLKDKKVILSVASGWNKEKGIDTVLKIAKDLKEDEKYLLVGNVGNIDLPENMLHIPTTSSIEELVQYYSLADVFVQPSLEETFGKVTAEALSCGTPVVCFNSTANPELVGEACGAVAEVGNLEDMLLKIRQILSANKQKYSQECRKFAKLSFDKQKNLEEYEALCKKLLNYKF